MTTKKRIKTCLNCNNEFIEKYKESNKQWADRSYCSIKCNNSSKERFTSIFIRLERYQVMKLDGCWKWTGTTDGKGYGVLSNRLGSNHSPEKAHRISYEKTYGEIPDGMNICHKCDNPECTNPEHLFVGTQKDNMTDCSKKGRINPISFLNLRPGAKNFKGAGPISNKEALKNERS